MYIPTTQISSTPAFIGARAVRANDLSIPDSTPTAVTFESVQYDTDSMWSAGAPDGLTINTPGKYAVGGHVLIDAAAAMTLVEVTILYGGTSSGLLNWPVPTTSTYISSAPIVVRQFAQGDFVQLVVNQQQTPAASATLHGTASASDTPVLWAYRIG